MRSFEQAKSFSGVPLDIEASLWAAPRPTGVVGEASKKGRYVVGGTC